jgi:hypothetical protein
MDGGEAGTMNLLEGLSQYTEKETVATTRADGRRRGGSNSTRSGRRTKRLKYGRRLRGHMRDDMIPKDYPMSILLVFTSSSPIALHMKETLSLITLHRSI